MTTQTQGKGKKKGKEVMKVSLDEFNQIDAPHGHSVLNVKVGVTGLDWAETMANHDEQAAEIQQIFVPDAPRALRGPGIDFASLSDEPPFRVSLFNLPVSAEEKEIERFLSGLQIISIDSTKASSTVELGSKQDLYDALCKDGSSLKGKTVNVCLYGQVPQSSYGSDRYGRNGNSSYGDRYGSDRNQGGGFGARSNDRYGDRNPGGGFSRGSDRDGGYARPSSGFGRGGYGQPRGGGYGDGFSDRGSYRDGARGSYTSAGAGEPNSDESTNWRAGRAAPSRASPPSDYNGSRQPYSQPRREPVQYNHPPASSQAPSHHQNQQDNQFYQPPQRGYAQNNPHYNNQQDQTPYPQSSHQGGGRPSMAHNSIEERPKLNLQKRKVPLDSNDDSSNTRNESIFGKAKPSSKPYEKLLEVEQKLSSVQISDKKEPRSSGPQQQANSTRAAAPPATQSPPSRQSQPNEAAPTSPRPVLVQPQPPNPEQAPSNQ